MPRIVLRLSAVYNPAKHRDIMPQRQIFTAAYRCGKTHNLAQAAHVALQGGCPLGRTLGLTVHRPAAQVLRDALSQATNMTVPVTTVRRRALTVLETHPAAAGLPPGWNQTALLSGIDRRLLIRNAWLRVGQVPHSLYHERVGQPGALDWVVLLFDRFSQWCGTSDPARLPMLEPIDPRVAELWQAYRAYLQLCRQLKVVAFNEVFNRAADVLRSPHERPESELALLLLDDLDLFQPAELLFVAELIDPNTVVFATMEAAPAPNSPLALDVFLQRWLARFGLGPERASNLQPRQPSLVPAEYLTPDDEAHAVAQQIAALAHTVQRWDEFAIVAFDQQLVPLLQRTLPLYGVPVVGQEARDGYTLALAPIAYAGLKLIAGDPLTDVETIGLLRHPGLGLSAAEARAAVEAVQHEHFQPFAEVGAKSVPRWPATLAAAGRLRLQAVHAATAAARAADGPPSEMLHIWLSHLGLDERCWAQTAAVLEPWAVALDRRHWARLLAFLHQSEALRAALGTPLTPAEAAELLRSAQALIQPEGKPQQAAVPIWPPAELGGCTAQVVFAVGLHEAALPQPEQPLPLADDAALAAAFGQLPGFVAPETTDRAAAWLRGERALQRTVSRASEAVYLSYSIADRQGRRHLPSPILADQLGTFIDRHGRLHGVNTQNMGRQAALERQQLPQPAILGNFEPERELASVQPATAGQPFVVTPSAIEDYFTCPRRCFFARELGLYDVASSPRQTLGTVVHNALNALLSQGRDVPISEHRAGQLLAEHWVADELRWGSQLKQAVFRQLAEQAVAQFARYEHDHGSAGTAFLGAELEVRWMLPATDVMLKGRIDRIDRTSDGLHVIDYKLGRQSPSLDKLLAEFVRPAAAPETWRPGDIQLPVYVLAVEHGEIAGVERLPEERVASIAQLYPLELYTPTGRVSAKGYRVIEIVEHESPCGGCDAAAKPGKTAKLCRAQLAAVLHEVRQAIAGMRAGAWQPDPRDGSTTCASCNFRAICPTPL